MTSNIGYIRTTYKVPAKVRGRVYVNGWPAKVVGTRGARLLIRLDKGGPARPYHPTDSAITYPGQPIDPARNKRVQAIQNGDICPQCEEATNAAGQCEVCDATV